MLNAGIIQLALTQVHIREIVGKKDNPEVIKYFEATGHGSLKDETAWCSAFANWIAKTLGLEHSGKLNARSWLDVGEYITSPATGDVVVFWRISKDDWRGHVGFYIREEKDRILVLGGNQNNQVCFKWYPKSRLLGYRRLRFLNN